MDVKETEYIFARIDQTTRPTRLEGVLPSRWRPNLEFKVTACSTEGKSAYDFSLKGRVGQYDPNVIAKMVFGDNVPMCYEVDLVGIKWGTGKRTNLLSLGFPLDWPAWSPASSDVRSAYEFDKCGLDTNLLSEVHVRIIGTQFGTSSNPVFVAEFVYSLEKFNSDAGYGIPLKFI